MGAGLPAIAIGIYTTVQFAAATGNHDAKRAALDLALDLLLILGAPLNHAGRNSTGIWGVNRQGCRFSRPAPWMARGGGPPNHCRITGTPSPSEVPSGGARAFCLLLTGPAFRLFKSEPPSGRNPKWPLPQQWICTQSNRVDRQAAFASKPAHSWIVGHQVDKCRLPGRHRRQASSHILLRVHQML